MFPTPPSLLSFLPAFFSVVAKLPDDHRMQLGRLFANIQQILTDPWDEDEDNSNANADTDKHKHKHKQKGRQHEQGEEEDEADAEGEDEEDEGGEEKEGKESRRESDDGARSTQSARRLLGLGNEEEDARSEITLLLQFAKEEVRESQRVICVGLYVIVRFLHMFRHMFPLSPVRPTCVLLFSFCSVSVMLWASRLLVAWSRGHERDVRCPPRLQVAKRK